MLSRSHFLSQLYFKNYRDLKPRILYLVDTRIKEIVNVIHYLVTRFGEKGEKEDLISFILHNFEEIFPERAFSKRMKNKFVYPNLFLTLRDLGLIYSDKDHCYLTDDAFRISEYVMNDKREEAHLFISALAIARGSMDLLLYCILRGLNTNVVCNEEELLKDDFVINNEKLVNCVYEQSYFPSLNAAKRRLSDYKRFLKEARVLEKTRNRVFLNCQQLRKISRLARMIKAEDLSTICNLEIVNDFFLVKKENRGIIYIPLHAYEIELHDPFFLKQLEENLPIIEESATHIELYLLVRFPLQQAPMAREPIINFLKNLKIVHNIREIKFLHEYILVNMALEGFVSNLSLS